MKSQEQREVEMEQRFGDAIRAAIDQNPDAVEMAMFILCCASREQALQVLGAFKSQPLVHRALSRALDVIDTTFWRRLDAS